MKKPIMILVLCFAVIVIVLSAILIKFKADAQKSQNENKVNYNSKSEIEKEVENELNENTTLKNEAKKDNKEGKIEFYSIKTTSGFSKEFDNIGYKIVSDEELNVFSSMFKGFELSKEYDLSENTIFIELETDSGDSVIDINDVKVDKIVYFDIAKKSGKTEDIAYWYLIAIIPNDMLEGVNTNSWKLPTEVKESIISEYKITVSSSDFNFIDFKNLVGEIVDSLDEMKTEECRLISHNNRDEYILVTYNKEICDELIEKIEKLDEGLEAEVDISNKNKSDYNQFKKELKKSPSQYYDIYLTSQFVSTDNSSYYRN